MVSEKGMEPFEVLFIYVILSSITNPTNCFVQVEWYLGETTLSLALMSSGAVDVAVTYHPAAEKRLLELGDAVDRVYAFGVSDDVFKDV